MTEPYQLHKSPIAGPPASPRQYDETVAEAKAIGRAAMGGEVQIRDSCLIIPCGVGKLQLWLSPKPWWRNFWPFNRKHGARHAKPQQTDR